MFKSIYELDWGDLDEVERYEVFGVAGWWSEDAAAVVARLYQDGQSNWTHFAWRGQTEFWSIMQKRPAGSTAWDHYYAALWEYLCHFTGRIPFMANGITMKLCKNMAQEYIEQWRLQTEHIDAQRHGDQKLLSGRWYQAKPSRAIWCLASREEYSRGTRLHKHLRKLSMTRFRELKALPGDCTEKFRRGSDRMWELELYEAIGKEMLKGAKTEDHCKTGDIEDFFLGVADGRLVDAIRRCEEMEYALVAHYWASGGEEADEAKVRGEGAGVVSLSSVFRFLEVVRTKLRARAETPFPSTTKFSLNPHQDFWEDVDHRNRIMASSDTSSELSFSAH